MKGPLGTDPGLEEVACPFSRPTEVRTMGRGWGDPVAVVEAEAIVTAYSGDSSRRSLAIRKQGVLHSCHESLPGPGKSAPTLL